MPILMCKDEEVYDSRTKEVFRKELLPMVNIEETFNYESFRRKRYFLNTNGASRQLMEGTPSEWIEKKLRFSLSDCYWYKYDDKKIDHISFATHSPYINHFTRLGNIQRDSAIPGQTLTGSFTKEWIVAEDGKRYMLKSGLPRNIFAEYFSVELAKMFDLRVNDAILDEESKKWGTIKIENITNIDEMLLDFRLLDIEVNGYSPVEISDVFGGAYLKEALEMVLFDAVVGNNDRKQNMGNIAVMKNSNTGVLTFPPLFDFNLSHIESRNYFLHDVATTLKRDGLEQRSIDQLHIWKSKIEEIRSGIDRKCLDIVEGTDIETEDYFPMWVEAIGYFKDNLEELLNFLKQ